MVHYQIELYRLTNFIYLFLIVMLEESTFPILAGSKERPATPIAAEQLKVGGANNGAFALHEGDVIEFFNEEPMVVSQKIRNTANSPVAYYVGVKRNGMNSWLPVGWFTRRNVKGEPIGKFQEMNLKCANFGEVYELWRGKTIKGGPMKVHQMPKFDQQTGQRIEGDSRPQSFSEVIF